ncbi:MAG: hypothetical protein ACXVRW_10995 [Solirubrobacteraceae bacterium]
MAGTLPDTRLAPFTLGEWRVQWREDARRQVRRAAAVHELEKLVQVDALLVGEQLSEGRGEPGAEQTALPPLHPALPVTGGVTGRV